MQLGWRRLGADRLFTPGPFCHQPRHWPIGYGPPEWGVLTTTLAPLADYLAQKAFSPCIISGAIRHPEVGMRSGVIERPGPLIWSRMPAPKIVQSILSTSTTYYDPLQLHISARVVHLLTPVGSTPHLVYLHCPIATPGHTATEILSHSILLSILLAHICHPRSEFDPGHRSRPAPGAPQP